MNLKKKMARAFCLQNTNKNPFENCGLSDVSCHKAPGTDEFYQAE